MWKPIQLYAMKQNSVKITLYLTEKTMLSNYLIYILIASNNTILIEFTKSRNVVQCIVYSRGVLDAYNDLSLKGLSLRTNGCHKITWGKMSWSWNMNMWIS